MLKHLAIGGAMIALLPFAAVALAQDAGDARAPASITVNGMGEASATPDMATLQIGVQSRGNTAAAAVAENNKAAQEVVDKLKEGGIPAERLQTSNFSVSPVYSNQRDPNNEGPHIIGYEARNQVIAEIHDLDNLGKLLDAAVESGANQIDGLSFGLNDPAEANDKARAGAVEDARQKAEILAEAAGVRLGDVLSIIENGGGPIPMQARQFAIAADSASVPIERGQTTVRANVQISWEIEQGGE